MAKRACNGCAAPFERSHPRQTLCPACEVVPVGNHTGWSAYRHAGLQAAFRRALLERAGRRCEEIDETTGERCTATSGLRACHPTPLSAGGTYDPDTNGKLRCRRHDRAADEKAR